MPKSADETAERGESLNDDSEVIELTEEIPAGASSSRGKSSSEKKAETADEDPQDLPAQDEFDALTREMPEFRVPDQGQSSDDSSDGAAGDDEDDEDDEEIVELRETIEADSEAIPETSEAVPSAAILSGRRSTRKDPAPQSVDETVDQIADDEPDEDFTETVTLEAQERPSDEDALGFEAPSTEETEAILDEDDVEEDAFEEDAFEGEVVEEDVIEEDAFEGEVVEGDAVEEDVVEVQESFDRQEMVKTIQMTAIDRKAFERNVQAEQLGESALLLDHSHAPDVVVFPPRVLTTRWKEGGPLLRAGQVEPPTGVESVEVEAQTLDEASDEREQASSEVEKSEQIQEFHEDEDEDEDSELEDERTAVEVEEPGNTLEEEDYLEIDPEAVELEIELESEATEDTSGVKPPPKPAPKPSAKPPKKHDEHGPKKQPKKNEAQEGDPELSGLVQELLDENKQQTREQRKKKAQKPRSPRETWFQKVFTEEYLRTLPKDIHRQTKREVDFIEESFDLDDNDRVLDLACGFGRHSIELTRRGYEVAGLDLSMPLLQKALNEAQKQSLSIKFIHGDMRELSFEGIFSACYLWQTSFGFFDDQTNFRVLRGIYRALKPGGRLLIDVLNRDHIVTEMPHRLWWEGVECVFLEEVDLDHRSSVLHTKRSFIYEDGSPPLEQNTYIRIYSLHELCQLLRAAGFAVREVSGELGHRGRFLGSASSRIIVQAQKRPPRGGRK